jgi:hypothetical protein
MSRVDAKNSAYRKLLQAAYVFRLICAKTGMAHNKACTRAGKAGSAYPGMMLLEFRPP